MISIPWIVPDPPGLVKDEDKMDAFIEVV